MKWAKLLQIRTANGKPTPAEADRIAAKLSREADPKQSLEDLFWALLNTNEFLFNH
jgi:hypothetical protein